ncbi:MAG: Cys-tRNA(Pro) deacylase [Bifidobacteriaceae bacterium]|nr:Cys-tRNA(Pro) deacylase [Bifidobacteriaceae bacterium]
MAKKKASAGGPRGTPALVALDRAGVAFEVMTYQAEPHGDGGYGLTAASALGLDPATVFKTLMARVDGQLTCAIVPVSGHLDLKALAKAVGGKKAEMAPVPDAERATGYVVGGISPLGQKTASPTVIDATAQGLEQVTVSAGARGLQVRLAPADLLRLTRGRYAPIGREGHLP